MTIPAYQATGTEAHVLTGALTPTNPAHVAGHWLLFAAEFANVSSFIAPSWPKVMADDRLVFTTACELGLWAKRAASSSEADPTATVTAGNHGYGNVVSFANVHQVHPLGPTTASLHGTSTVPSLPGLRTLVDDCLLVWVIATPVDTVGANFSGESHAVLTVTERVDGATTDGNGGGFGLWTAPASAADHYAPGTVTDASAVHVSAAFALNPIADIPITVAVTLDGVAHAGGDGTVRLIDVTQEAASYLVLDAATETNPYVTGLDGSGQAAFVVPYNDHEYIAMYFDDSGSLTGCSEKITFGGGAFPTATIAITVVGSGGGGGDTTPPTITVVSPTPGVAPGDPGGFSSDFDVARVTPIVIDITDAAPGLEYVCIVVRYPGSNIESTVYRRGAFRGQFIGTSSAAPIAGGLRFTILPQGGWPGSDAATLTDISFDVDVIDGDGNLAA